MKYVIKITPRALADLDGGVDFYNEQQKGLGSKFSTVIKGTFIKIKEMPFAASISYDDVRYKVVDKFPYLILYRLVGNSVHVLRVFNTHQQTV